MRISRQLVVVALPGALFLGAFFSSAGLAQPAAGSNGPAKRPMIFEDMMKMRRLGETDVSPDGKWLVYSVTDVDLAANSQTAHLYIQPIAGGEPKPLVGTEAGDGGARFSHDGKRLLFLSSRGGSQQIWTISFDPATGGTSEARKVTSISTWADNAQWAPDGNSIVFTSAVYPDCPAFTFADASSGSTADKCNADRDAAQAANKVKARVFDHLLYKHWNAFTGDKRSHLFLLSINEASDASPTAPLIRDLTPNDPNDVPPFSLDGGCGCAISPDSKELAFTENLDEEPAISTNADIFTLDLADAKAQPVKVSTSPGGDFNPAYSPDGKYLAWRSQARAGYESDKFRLTLYDRGSKSIQYLLHDLDGWIDEFAWGPANSHFIYFTSGSNGEVPILAVDVESASNVPWKLPVVLQAFGDYANLHATADGTRIVVSKSGVQLPAEVVKFDVSSGGQLADEVIKIGTDRPIKYAAPWAISDITQINTSVLAPIELSKMESFWFRAKDGVKVQGFVIKPPGFEAAKKYPVKFLIHGGPQGAWGDAWSYRWNAELLAANGYVVVMINPRGSTGYGQAFVEGVSGDWGGKPFDDLMTGLDYAEKSYPFIDKTRECALGASYGGYMANWILGHTDRFKCIVTHDGMFDPESAYGSTEELWFNEWEFKGKPWDYYGKPDNENPYRKWSPALSAKNFKTPTLVIHSQLDYRLDVSEGYQLFTTLQRLKVPSRMLYFPDEGHFVQKPQNSQLWYKTVNDWVDQWIGQKVGNKE